MITDCATQVNDDAMLPMAANRTNHMHHLKEKLMRSGMKSVLSVGVPIHIKINSHIKKTLTRYIIGLSVAINN